MTNLQIRRDFRVFISYSQEDLPIVKNLVQILHNNGLNPTWDKSFAFSDGVHDQIKTLISHSHIFMPVVTPASIKRGWVHQEIGFAMALNIPVLPVAIGKLPIEMIKELNAIQATSDLTNLETILTYEKLTDFSYSSKTEYHFGFYSDFIENTIQRIIKYLEEFRFISLSNQFIRQETSLFAINIPEPDQGKNKNQNRYLDQLLQKEHILLVDAITKFGYRLIININSPFESFNISRKIEKLHNLKKYLQNLPDENVAVVINSKDPTFQKDILMYGNLFSCESIAEKSNNSLTVFVTNALAIDEKIIDFDNLFNFVLSQNGSAIDESKEFAIKQIDDIINYLKSKSIENKIEINQDAVSINHSTKKPPHDIIFISAKSEDFDYANIIFNFLNERGYNVFFSKNSLPELGSSDYRREIDNALDRAKHMIVITSSKKNVTSWWVEAEWGLFINEKRSGRKWGNLLTIIFGDMKIDNLPSSLRYYEVIPFDQNTIDKILKYLK